MKVEDLLKPNLVPKEDEGPANYCSNDCDDWDDWDYLTSADLNDDLVDDLHDADLDDDYEERREMRAMMETWSDDEWHYISMNFDHTDYEDTSIRPRGTIVTSERGSDEVPMRLKRVRHFRGGSIHRPCSPQEKSMGWKRMTRARKNWERHRPTHKACVPGTIGELNRFPERWLEEEERNFQKFLREEADRESDKIFFEELDLEQNERRESFDEWEDPALARLEQRYQVGAYVFVFDTDYDLNAYR